MTEPKKPRAAKPKEPERSKSAPRGKTVLGQTITDSTGTKAGHSDDIMAAAKALWEGDPQMTIRMVATEIGVPYATVDKWSKGGRDGKGEKWKKRLGDMSERAQQAADNYKTTLGELGPEITTEQQQQAVADAAEQTAVDLRATVLDRHRKEWNAPRQISYEAIKEKNFDRMKQAKITAETLKIIQDGERKAWGIDSGPGGEKVTVVIERE